MHDPIPRIPGPRARHLSALLGGGGALFLACAAHADCLDPAEYVHWVSSVPTGGEAIGVDVVGGLAYVADGDAGLTIVDVSDPTAPLVVANHPLPGRAYEVQVRGDHAYLACGNAGLVTVDVTDLGALQTTSVSATDGVARALDIEDDHLVLAITRVTPGGLLETYDLGIPRFPILRDQVGTPRRANDVQVRDGLAFVSTLYCDESGCAGGLGVYDVSDPSSVVKVAYRALGPITGVWLEGDLAYVSSDFWGLWVVDISDPTFPQIVRSEGGFSGYDVAVREDVVLVAAEGLALVDVEDPADPLFVGSVASPPAGPTDTATRLQVVDDLAYVTGSGRLNLVRVENPHLLGPEETLPAAHHVGSVGRMSATLAVAADSTAGVVAYDVGPDHLVERGRVDLGTAALDVASVGSVALVAAGAMGLVPVDVTDPDAPVVGDPLSTTWPATAVAAGSTLGLAATGQGEDGGALLVLDLADPLAPALLGELVLDEGVIDAAFRPSIGAPQASSFVRSATETPQASSLRSGTEQAVILAGDRVHAIDLTDPTAPVIAASWTLPGSPRALALSARHAFVVSGAAGLGVVDLVLGEVMATLELPGVATKVSRLPDARLLVGLGDDGVIVVDVQDPVRPLPQGLLDVPSVTGFASDPEWILVGTGAAGVARFSGPCQVVGIADAPAPPSAVHLVARPNPFWTGTMVAFDLSRRGTVKGMVVDAAGRQLRALASPGPLDPGLHELHWDGRDDSGSAVGPGVYFIRVHTPDGELRAKIIRAG